MPTIYAFMHLRALVMGMGAIIIGVIMLGLVFVGVDVLRAFNLPILASWFYWLLVPAALLLAFAVWNVGEHILFLFRR